jgi:very-short-patch-repair endonuclease
MEALSSIYSKLPTGNLECNLNPKSPHAMLWAQLNENLVLGLPFDYKVNMDGYLLDFYCPLLGLAIEIVPTLSNGSNTIKDLHKEKLLKMNGIKVLQFSHYDVSQQIGVVITTIKYWIKTYKRAAA